MRSQSTVIISEKKCSRTGAHKFDKYRRSNLKFGSMKNKWQKLFVDFKYEIVVGGTRSSYIQMCVDATEIFVSFLRARVSDLTLWHLAPKLMVATV